MDLAHSRMVNNESLNKDPYVVPEQGMFIILDSKSTVCVDNNVKDTKNSRHISRRKQFVINGEDCNFHKTVWCKRDFSWQALEQRMWGNMNQILD